MSATTKTVTVLGALGAQGGSVVKSLMEENRKSSSPIKFNIRAVTRSVDSDAAKALKEKAGDDDIEIVAGNTKEPDSLAEAFRGADAAYIVVNFWDPEIMTKELELTKKILDVAKKEGVQQILYAALADVEKVSGGKFDVPHFTMKAKSFEYAKTLDFKYVTAIEAACYYSNWFTFFKPAQEDDGTLVFKYPGKGKVSQFDPKTDTGPAVVAALKDPEKYNNKFILLQADNLTAEETIALISKKLGKPARVEYVDPKTFGTFFPGAQELAEMVQWFDEYGYYGPETEERKWESGKEIAKMLSFEEWLDTKEYEKLMASW